MDLKKIKERLSGSGYQSADPAHYDQLAAVALVIKSAKSDSEILLIRRAEREGDPWSGQMALPGGRREPGDADLFEAVLREAHEEVGLDLREHGEPIGRLDDLPALSGAPMGMLVTPFVFELRGSPRLSLNHEVAEALWAPLAPMRRGEINAIKIWRYAEEDHQVPAYDVRGRIVWGLTYRILQDLFDKLED